jgi:hypothetical protein
MYCYNQKAKRIDAQITLVWNFKMDFFFIGVSMHITNYSKLHSAQNFILLKTSFCSKLHSAQNFILLKTSFCSKLHSTQNFILLKTSFYSKLHSTQLLIGRAPGKEFNGLRANNSGKNQIMFAGQSL